MTNGRWSILLVALLWLSGSSDGWARGGRKAPPGSFTLSSPSNGATGVSVTPTLSWTGAARASSYSVQVDSDASFAAPLAYTASVSTTSATVSSGLLTAGTRYYWRVTATNAYGNTTASNAPFSLLTTGPDITPPTVSISASPALITPNSTVTYSASAQDTSGISEIRIFVDGVNVASSFGNTSCSFIGGPYLLNSIHSFYATARDASPAQNAAQTVPSSFTVTSGPVTTSSLAAVQYVDNSTIVAVGANDFLKSSDGGVTWTRKLVTSSTFMLFDVFFSSPLVGTVVGGNPSYDVGNVILRTIDGGATWTPQNSGTRYTLLAVSFCSDQIGTIVGYPTPGALGGGDTILHTIDGGTTWTRQTTGLLGSVIQDVVQVDALNAFAVAIYDSSRGGVFVTRDGGLTWGTQRVTSHWLRALSHPSSSTWVAAGNYSTVERSTDGGSSWSAQTLTSNIYENIVGVSFGNSLSGFTAADTGSVFRTVDGGATWQDRTPLNRSNLGDIACRDANTAVAVGVNGYIAQTLDGGASWIRRN